MEVGIPHPHRYYINPNPQRMSGINKQELDEVLSRVFARHLIPLELRLIIWKLLDLKGVGVVVYSLIDSFGAPVHVDAVTNLCVSERTIRLSQVRDKRMKKIE